MTVPRMVFDIETGPLSVREIRKITKFDGESGPKLRSNLKEETKKKKLKEWEENKEQNEKEFYFKLRSTGTLNPLYGEVLAIGMKVSGVPKFNKAGLLWDESEHAFVLHGAESNVLERFWIMAGEVNKRGGKIFGYNIHEFDLPWLMARSMIQFAGKTSPGRMFLADPVNEYGKWHMSFVDLAKVWLSCRYSRAGSSFTMPRYEDLCSAFGIVAKSQGFRGDQFHKKWHEGTKESFESCMLYATEEAESLWRLSNVMCPSIY